MKSTCFALVTLATIAAARESALASLTDTERLALESELAAWKASPAGLEAAAEGYLPEAPSKLEAATIGEDLSELERFHLAKEIVARLSVEQPSAKFSVNSPFALMTEEEFAGMVRGSFEQSRHLREAVETVQDEELRELSVQADDSVDWTTHKCLTDIRNQGKCGSCYAFAAVAVAEFAHCLATGEKVDVAVQQIVSCDSISGGGCEGGSASAAMNYLSRTPVCLAKDYPYTSGTTKVNGECITSCPKKQLKIGSTTRLWGGERDLQASLKLRATAVTVEAGNDAWRFYDGGVITSCPGKRSDHAVLAVGYGTTPEGVQYYTIKNSWGANWGNKGFLKIQRNNSDRSSGMCNIGEGPMYHRKRN